MAKSRLSKYIEKIVRFKKKGGVQYLDEFGEPCGQMKQLRVFHKDNYNELFDLVICEHQ